MFGRSKILLLKLNPVPSHLAAAIAILSLEALAPCLTEIRNIIFRFSIFIYRSAETRRLRETEESEKKLKERLTTAELAVEVCCCTIC